MISSDLGIVTAYAEAVSKGYTGTREEFGQMLADFSKSEKKVAEDRAAVEKAKKEVDDTVETFDTHVTEKTTEATQAITDHTETEKTNATAAIGSAKDSGVAAVNSEIEKKGKETLESIPDDYTELSKKVDELSKNLGDGSLSFSVNADDGGLDITYTP